MKKLLFVFVFVLLNNRYLIDISEILWVYRSPAENRITIEFKEKYNKKGFDILYFGNDKSCEDDWIKLIEILTKGVKE